MLRKYWLGILVLLLFGIAIASVLLSPLGTSTLISNIANKVEFISITLGWALAIVQYLYNKSESFYIAVNSIRLWITNETTKWNFNVDFYGGKQSTALEKISKIISNQNPKSMTWHKDSNSLIVNMPGYTIRVILVMVNNAHDDQDRFITVQISNLELPFRSFKAKIENEIIPLLLDIDNTIKSSNQKYVAKIGFSVPNPYFGFFVRKLDLPKVVSFTCDILENTVGGHPQNVVVRKDKIEIVTDNLNALQSLSFKYMALSGK